jgi:hypothetical protein
LSAWKIASLAVSASRLPACCFFGKQAACPLRVYTTKRGDAVNDFTCRRTSAEIMVPVRI